MNNTIFLYFKSYDISNIEFSFFKIENLNLLKKENWINLGKLNVDKNFQIFQKEKIKLYSEKKLKYLLELLTKEKEKIQELDLYNNNLLKTVEEDIKLLKKCMVEIDDKKILIGEIKELNGV